MIQNISDNLLFKGLRLIKYGHLKLTNYDGKKYCFGEEGKDLNVELKIKKPGFAFGIIRKGSIGFAESYMRGDFETNNLSDLIELTARNIKIIYKFSGLFDFPFINYVKNIFSKNTKKNSKEYISKHYDLGNEFFSLWLDPSLTYSSAIFERKESNLESAQMNKYKKLLSLLNPKPRDKILEIGCGWGGFAEFVGKNYDIKMDCITISKKQFEYASKRIFKSGLNEKVKIKMKDYRDVQEKYNSIASIEMIEAVGKNYLSSYFNTIKSNLSEKGNAAIQAITINDDLYDRYKTKQDFIQKYIFPGGFLPSKKSLYKLSSSKGLDIKNYDSYGFHYSNTLKLWRDEFLNKWDQISGQGFDLSFKRMWHFYLSYCEAGFNSKNIDLIQFSLQNR